MTEEEMEFKKDLDKHFTELVDLEPSRLLWGSPIHQSIRNRKDKEL